MSDDEQNQLLQLLEAHGQQFMASFDYPQSQSNKRKEAAEAGPSNPKKKRRQEPESDDSISGGESEWAGFADTEDEELDFDEDESEDDDDSDNSTVQEEVSDTRKPDVVHFNELGRSSSTSALVSKAHQKAFMSSKVTKLTQEVKEERQRNAPSNEDEDDEFTNAQNDALLHRLVHTKLLSGSLNAELDLTPSQRRKALAGRVLEAAGQVKLGKGETAVRAKERNKAAKHVRDGLIAKQKQRNEKALEEAKNMGNYHPTLKKLYEDQLESQSKPKRERGLKMGVGSFSGGTLKLSRNDIASVTGKSRGAGRGRGRGRGSSRGGRRK